MRNIIKKLNKATVQVNLYNTVTKAEETIEVDYFPDVESAPTLPAGCVEISRTEVRRQEIKMKLTMEKYVRHAVVLEDQTIEVTLD